MKTIKTAELSDAPLDWAVATAEGMNPHAFVEHDCGQRRSLERWCGVHVTPGGHTVFAPSTDWAQGGPIIEREGIQLSGWESRWEAKLYWSKAAQGGPKRYWNMTGPNPLIAAMRCYVASKLGLEVEVPEELLPLKPCRSPYCECTPGQCTHPGCYDARGTEP